MTFAPDLYPRQRMGFVMVLVGVLVMFVAIGAGYHPQATLPELFFMFYLGMGMGFMAGNTRTLRTRSGKGWRTR